MKKLVMCIVFMLSACATTLDPDALDNEVNIWARTSLSWQVVSRSPCLIEAQVDGHLLRLHGIGIGCIEQSLQVIHKPKPEGTQWY